MTTLATPTLPLEFPDSDGERMSDNTLQFKAIVTLHGNLELLFRDRPDVFVAGDHLIYVDPSNPAARIAPDVYVVFGRHKGHRGSYRLWDEAGIFPQVVFEVWSPGNTESEMSGKRAFCERHGAQEFYIFYPVSPSRFEGWVRQDERLVRVREMDGHVSPLLGIRFAVEDGEAWLYHPDGQRFLSYVERGEQEEVERQRAESAEERAERERERAESERERAERERERAESAEERAERERERAESERERAAKLAARLRELGLDPEAL